VRAAIVAGLLVLAGCSGANSTPAPVAGRVIYRGYGVRGGLVAFTPDKERGHQGAGASVRLNADGSFRLPNGGLLPGWYRITVASLDMGIPVKYRDPEHGNLVREVVAGIDNVWDIVLED
jgi:hypothetical protein